MLELVRSKSSKARENIVDAGCDAPREWTMIVHHGGRSFLASETMANIFSAHAHDLMDRGDTELVPLLHSKGVDLLLVGPTTKFVITPIEVDAAQTAAKASPVQTARLQAG